ncbi:MAG: NAD+ synthase [Desulfovibrio sp.]|jgi:NAD+ synthase (glutamine-hydrolysing)|nr:NAD+ synthase [Desulfovibrio sp.]
MKIALIQSNPVTGDLRTNAAALALAVARAAEQGAELCVAPELALCGHNAGDMLLQSGFVEDCRTVLHATAESLGRENSFPPLLLGAPVANPIPQGKKTQNCAVLLKEGKVSVIGRKVLLPSFGIHEDTRYFEPGVACGVLHHKGWRLVVTVGEDVWNDRTFWQSRYLFTTDPVAEFIASGGADGLINLTALPFEQGLAALHHNMLRWLAVQYRLPVLAVNMVGGNDSLVYYGGSLVLDGGGRLLARAPAFEEATLMTDIASKKGGSIAADLSAEEELWQALVLGTRDFVRKCHFSSIVLGLSSGVDSALVAAVAVEALGPDKVTGLIMPSPYSPAGSIDASLTLAASLGMRVQMLPISSLLQSFHEVFSSSFTGGLTGPAEENILTRIRGSLLMTWANRFNALLLNTGNKSEAAVGYGTLYGDMTGGLSPIGDLYKRQVYSLCRWYNGVKPKSIPEAVLNKPPSAGLRSEHVSSALPPYEQLEPLLHDIIENGCGAAELAATGYAPDMVTRVKDLMRRAEFKRRQAPPILHLSKRGFGGDWRFPIAATDG